MKKCFITLTVFLVVLSGSIDAQTRSQYTIRGIVFDATANTPLRNVKVVLKNADSNIVIQTTTTSAEGQYALITKRSSSSFIAEASISGYITNRSQRFNLNAAGEINLDPIYLQKKGSGGTGTPVHVDTLSPDKMLEKKFLALNYLPTNGAYELFYALNPALRNKDMVPDNYNLKYPRLPEFGSVRKKFNRRFKKDKKRGEPFISQIHFTDPEIGVRHSFTEKAGLFNFPAVASTRSVLGEEFMYSGMEVFTDAAGTNEYVSTSGRYKKFVFALWKYSANGVPITDGPEVAGKYTVIYYTGRNRGDESAYNKASNATYGYAPMLDARYYIEVYDGDTKKRVRVGEDEVDPHLAFEQKDIVIRYNISYTKILIKVYD